MTTPTMLRRVSRVTRESALWAGAVLGALCLVVAIASYAFGITPLVFRSGSMQPAISTGSLGFAREIPVGEARVGDVVSAVDVDGVRVTHRVVGLGSGSVVLQGDANAHPDPLPYTTPHVDRVFVDVPYLGYAAAWAAGPVGVFAGGVLVGGVLLMAFRRRPDNPGAHRRRAAGVMVLALVASGGAVVRGASPTMASFTDSAAGASTLTTFTVPPPTGPVCTNGVGLIYAGFGWTGVGAGYSYRVVVRRADNANVVSTTDTTATSVVLSGALLGSLLSTNLVASVAAFPTAATSWTSTIVSVNFRANALGLGSQCGHL